MHKARMKGCNAQSIRGNEKVADLESAVKFTPHGFAPVRLWYDTLEEAKANHSCVIYAFHLLGCSVRIGTGQHIPHNCFTVVRQAEMPEPDHIVKPPEAKS